MVGSESNGDDVGSTEVETCVKQTSHNLPLPPSLLPNNNNNNLKEEGARTAVFSPPVVNRRSLNESINNTMSGSMPREAEISSHENCVGAPLNLKDQIITDNYQQQEGEETGLKSDIANGNNNNTNGNGGVKSEADAVASIHRNYFKKEDTTTTTTAISWTTWLQKPPAMRMHSQAASCGARCWGGTWKSDGPWRAK